MKVVADYGRLVKQRPTAHVVAFVRTNVVKAVVSAERGQMTYRLCGADNLRAEEAAKCQIPRVLHLEVGRFKRLLFERMVLERRFLDLVYGLGRPVFEVTYEDLQADAAATIAALMRHLGRPGNAALAAAGLPTKRLAAKSLRPRAPSSRGSGSTGTIGGSGHVPSGSSGGGDGWVKRTSDDLSHHVDNFPELRAALVAAASPCLVAQLDAKAPGIPFPPCPLPPAWQAKPPPPVPSASVAPLPLPRPLRRR